MQNLTRGGAERQAVLTALALRDRGDLVRVFVQAGPDSLRADGVTGSLPLDMPAGNDSAARQIGRLYRVVHAFAPDAVITFQRGPTVRFGIIRTLSAVARRAAWIVAARGNLRLFYLRQTPASFASHLHWQRAADRVCANSSALGSNLFAMDSGLANKVAIIPNILRPFPVDTPRARQRVDEMLGGVRRPVIGCVGSFQTERNHELLAEALPLIVQRCRTAHVLVVGRNSGPWVGRFAEAFLSRIRRSGLRGHVTLLGEVADARALIPGFDVFALSSKLEGSSNALAEAMIAGVPTATTPVGDAVELTAGAAVVSRGWTPSAFAEAVLTALDQGAALRRSAADRGQTLLIAQTPERIGALWSALIEDAMIATRRRLGAPS